MDPGGSPVRTQSQKAGLNLCCDFPFAVFMGFGERNKLVFSQHSPAHRNKIPHVTGHLEPGKTQGKLNKAGTTSLVHRCIQSAVMGQQREFVLCSETRESSGAHAQEIRAQTISFKNVVGSQT